MKNYMKIFQFMTFHTKLQQEQNHCVLGSIKKVNLLGFVVLNSHVKYYLIMDCLIKFAIRLNIFLISKKSGNTQSINHNFEEIRIDSYNSLPTEKLLTFHYVIVLVKSAVNNDKNNYCDNIFLERNSYQGKFDARYF